MKWWGPLEHKIAGPRAFGNKESGEARVCNTNVWHSFLRSHHFFSRGCSTAEFFIFKTLNVLKCILDSGNHFRTESPLFDNFLALSRRIQTLLMLWQETPGGSADAREGAEGLKHRRRAAWGQRVWMPSSSSEGSGREDVEGVMVLSLISAVQQRFTEPQALRSRVSFIHLLIHSAFGKCLAHHLALVIFWPRLHTHSRASLCPVGLTPTALALQLQVGLHPWETEGERSAHYGNCFLPSLPSSCLVPAEAVSLLPQLQLAAPLPRPQLSLGPANLSLPFSFLQGGWWPIPL